MNRRQAIRFGMSGAALGLSTIHAQPVPGALNATWVHGTSVQLEEPATIESVSRFGWGSTFRGKPGKFAWSHVSVPVPVLVDDVRSMVEKVFVLYRANGATIKSVHAYDGPRKIREFNGLILTDDQSGGITPKNNWVLDPPAELAFGLGISIGVQYSIGFDSRVTTEITFTTAGADFRPHKLAVLQTPARTSTSKSNK